MSCKEIGQAGEREREKARSIRFARVSLSVARRGRPCLNTPLTRTVWLASGGAPSYWAARAALTSPTLALAGTDRTSATAPGRAGLRTAKWRVGEGSGDGSAIGECVEWGWGGQWCVCVDAIKTGATRAVRGETRGRVERVQAGSSFPQPSPSIFSLSRALSLVFTTLGKRITQGRTISFSLSRVMQRESKGRHNQHHGTGGVIVPAGLPACLFEGMEKKV